jgi:hypothetical protein
VAGEVTIPVQAGRWVAPPELNLMPVGQLVKHRVVAGKLDLEPVYFVYG